MIKSLKRFNMSNIDFKLPFANILTIFILIIGGVGTFAKLEAAYSHLELRVKKTEEEVRNSEDRVMKRLDLLHQDIREIRSTQMKQNR